MKKFTAIVLALVFAFAAATTAFAAASVYECPACHELIEGEANFNNHLDKTCSVVGSEGKAKVCPNEGCGAEFKIQKEYEKHLEVCYYKPEPTIADKVSDFISGIDFKEVFGKVTDFLGGIDFAGLAEKLIGVIEDLIGEIK
ncbi:MAG: hypothetical protein IJE74_06185 [Clostridia bacterium]|nr:hypothetical protein [Clostridia bacterium]